MPPDPTTSIAPADSVEEIAGTAPPAVPGDALRDGSHALVEALGAAWSAFTLYHDPTQLDVFRRAVESIASTPEFPCQIDVGPEGFISGGDPIPTRREAVRRLARRMFAHGIAAVVVWSPPSSEDLRRILEVTSTAPDALRAAGGPESVLEVAEVNTIALPHRDLLVEAALAGRTDRTGSGLPAAEADLLSATGAGPQRFVSRLLARSSGDPERLARFFAEDYARVYRDLEQDDLWSREEVIHAFTEAIFHLPEQYRARLVADLLKDPEEERSRMLLDQFTGHDLTDLIPHLDRDAHPLLRDYTRVAAEQEKGGARRDLLDLLDRPDDEPPSDNSISRRIEAILRANPDDPDQQSGPLVRLRAARPSEGEHSLTSAEVLQELLAAADDADFRRLAARWADRVSTELEHGRYAAAEARFDDAARGASRSAQHRRLLLRTLELRLTPPGAEHLAELMIRDEGSLAEGRLLRKAAPLFAGEALIDLIGREVHRTRRQKLLAALSIVSRRDPRVLIRHLEDARWFVVRNLVLALGRSRHPEIAKHLEPLTRHRDARVRSEVLLAIHRLHDGISPDAALRALDDSDEEIRAQAAGLLAGIPEPRVDDVLVRRAGDPELADRDRLLAVETLANRPTADASAALDRLAGRRFEWSRANRAVRRAARTARRARS